MELQLAVKQKTTIDRRNNRKLAAVLTQGVSIKAKLSHLPSILDTQISEAIQRFHTDIINKVVYIGPI